MVNAEYIEQVILNKICNFSKGHIYAKCIIVQTK